MLRLLDRSLPARKKISRSMRSVSGCRSRSRGRDAAVVGESARVVVVGRSGVISNEVEREACAADGVAVLRRDSGGGAVLLGPGCMSYSLLLSVEKHPRLRDVRLSYRLILGCLVRALAVPGLEIRGVSDLAIGGRKVSGNAQRRGRQRCYTRARCSISSNHNGSRGISNRHPASRTTGLAGAMLISSETCLCLVTRSGFAWHYCPISCPKNRLLMLH